MINLQFNSYCPFCNSALIKSYDFQYCNHCANIHNCFFVRFYYNCNNIESIFINNKNYKQSINIYLIEKQIFNSITKYIPFQDFNSIQDLLDIINIHMLFT